MACHIIQTAPGQVGGEKRVRSWGAAANRGAAWRIRSIFHDSSVVDRAMSCPGAIQIKAIRTADKASFLAPAIEFLITSYLERSLDDTYVASLLYAMIHDLYGCRASPTYSAGRCSGRVGNVGDEYVQRCDCSVPTAIPPRKSRAPNLRLNHHSTPPGGSDRRDRFGDIKAGSRTWQPVALFAPARKYELDLARALVHEGDLLLDDDIAEAAQLRRQ